MRAGTLGQLALMTLICLIFFLFFGIQVLTHGSSYGEPGYEALLTARYIHALIVYFLIALLIAFLITAVVTYIFELRAKMKKFVASGLSKP